MRGILGDGRREGPGQGEVRKMAGVPPTCSTCGSILVGYERNKELNTFTYFCINCRRTEEKATRLRAKEEVAEVEVLREAA